METAFRKGQLRFFGDLSPLQDPAAFAAYLAPLRHVEWVVYAKAPFGCPEQVVQYLGRYTHRTALSNRRLLEDRDGKITFQWKELRLQGSPQIAHHDFGRCRAAVKGSPSLCGHVV
jgi:hypothetical protein